MNKKTRKQVLILTQPLMVGNYGGILQAYALQKTINRIGHIATTNNFRRKTRLYIIILGGIKRFIKKTITKKSNYIVSGKVEFAINEPTMKFVDERMSTTNICNQNGKVNHKKIRNFSAFVVGSDQVWRKKYSHLPLHLLEFIRKNLTAKKVSYAASFGTDDLSEYGARLIKKTAKLAKKFDALSVREDSGVDICRKYWGVNATQVVDPTLLLGRSDYLSLVSEDEGELKPSSGEVFTYILDKNAGKKQIIDNISKKLNMQNFEIMPDRPKSKKEFYDNMDKFIQPPVTQWIKSFDDAKFVITDSFHGCVFSIIFNKPFIAIGNKDRGLARFNSLLKIFTLEDRLISLPAELTDELISKQINWNYVNSVVKLEQERSLKFLKENLS